jgi:CRP-like cAMP-binding protein
MSVDALELVPLFQGLDPQGRSVLAGWCRSMVLEPPGMVFEQGDRADMLYILVAGRVAIRFKPYDGDPLTVAEVRPGDVFGWSALLRRPAYTSGAVALEESRVLAVSGAGLRRLCRARPELGALILDRLVAVIPERLKGAHSQVVELLRQGMGPEAGEE